MQTRPLGGVNIAANAQPRNVSRIAKTQTLGLELQADEDKETCRFTSSILLPTPESGYVRQRPSELHHQINLKPPIGTS